MLAVACSMCSTFRVPVVRTGARWRVFHVSCPDPTCQNELRKFRLRKRSQVIDPLAVVSDGNGRASRASRAIEQSSNRATEHTTSRTTSSSIHDARFGPSPGIIPSVTYSHVYYTCPQYVRRPFLRIAISQDASRQVAICSRSDSKLKRIVEEDRPSVLGGGGKLRLT